VKTGEDMSRYTEFTRALVRKFAHALLLTALLVTGTVMLIIVSNDNNPQSQQQTQQAQNDSKPAWGDEALSHVYHGMSKMSPIALANACGLGASSCFKCHNGRRAPAVDKKLWHTQHEPVNYSCAGCHQGNPRLMIKSMAHNKMLSDPRTNLKLACSTCHSGDDMAVLSKHYMSSQGEK
jgi:hypothetical protein